MYKIDDIVSGKVLLIKKTYLNVSIKDDWLGILHISEVSDYYISSLSNLFKKDQEIHCSIIKVDEKKKNVALSFKKINPQNMKAPFNYLIKETEKGFTNLKKNTMKEVEKW
ncbi:MAG: S1 RNA-binding domain-containing protein [Mycoplasma sp.]|nr:S1 RNA-binding domain-containing protein [Mycoplasma sp.]